MIEDETTQQPTVAGADHVAEVPENKSRRRLLGGAAVGSAALIAGAVGGVAGASVANADSNHANTFDVACLGETIRITSAQLLANGIEGMYAGVDVEQGDNRGSPFWVEGLLFAGGTITSDSGFIPRIEESLGTWICRGFFMTHVGRPEPHMTTEQQFVFGGIDAPGEMGTEMLITSGIEGRNEPGWSSRRAVVGGTGAYRGARGEVLQEMIGRNSTVFPWGGNALNFRMTFDFDGM